MVPARSVVSKQARRTREVLSKLTVVVDLCSAGRVGLCAC